MTWTIVEVLNKTALDGGVQRVSIRVSTDDATPRTHDTQIDIPPGASTNFFDSSVRLLLKRLADRDAAKAQADAIPVGGYTPGPDPQPDPDQATKDTFIANVRLLAQLQKAVEIGLILANDSRLTTLRTNMQTQFNALTTAQQLKVVGVL